MEGDQTKVDGNGTNGDSDDLHFNEYCTVCIPLTHRPESSFSFHSLKNLFPRTVRVGAIMVVLVLLKQLIPSRLLAPPYLVHCYNFLIKKCNYYIIIMWSHMYTTARIIYNELSNNQTIPPFVRVCFECLF